MMRGEAENYLRMNLGYLFYDRVLEPMYNSLPESFTKSDFLQNINAKRLQGYFYKDLADQAKLMLLNKDTIYQLIVDLDYIGVFNKYLRVEKEVKE